MAARAVKRAALNAALAAQRASAVVAVDRFPKRLRTDGQDVVELFVSGPGALMDLARLVLHGLVLPATFALTVHCADCKALQPAHVAEGSSIL